MKSFIKFIGCWVLYFIYGMVIVHFGFPVTSYQYWVFLLFGGIFQLVGYYRGKLK